ncbi:MAG TPA: hypothetical protein PLA92_04375, partial [Fimbriimonadaceae bacterium]|nr:hypothetical protein [Fimbriimonadaceae bacterium]
VDDKWLGSVAGAVQREVDRLSQILTQRLRQLADRYELPLPRLQTELEDASKSVATHLAEMGVLWS